MSYLLAEEREVQFTGLNNIFLEFVTAIFFVKFDYSIKFSLQHNKISHLIVLLRPQVLISCFYGDHNQLVNCREIQKHSVTCFSQLDFSRTQISPLLSLNTVLVRNPFVKMASSCLQLSDSIPAPQRGAQQWEQEGSWWREKAGEVHCYGGGESLDAVAIAWVWRLLEREGRKRNRSRAAKHLHARWGVGQATGTYGWGPLTQPEERILPNEGKADTVIKGRSWAKCQSMDFL